MKIVVLVPYRARQDNELTSSEYSFVKGTFARYGFPLYEADAPGQWNRSASINLASEKAGDWDIAIVADADTIHYDINLLNAAAFVASSRYALIPWTIRWKLDRNWSEVILREGLPLAAAFDMAIDKDDNFAHNDVIADYPSWRCGSTIIIHREAWDLTNGFDEKFVGWGYEDCAHRIALWKLTGQEVPRSKGTILHLWHPKDHGLPHLNRRRFQAYEKMNNEQIKKMLGAS